MNTKEFFLILLNSYLILMKIVFKMPLGGWRGRGGVKGPRADDMPRAPRTVNPAQQLGLNSVDGLTDLNGGAPVPLLCRGPPVPLEQPTVFACILSQL
jgi:hypothetical protein